MVRGLASAPRRLPSQYFYDATGARLFEQICQLDVYYLTRAELAILDRHGRDMASAVGAHVRLVELGSGSAVKARLLLAHLEAPREYVPVDVSREQLMETATALRAEFPSVRVTPVCADYLSDFTLPPPVAGTRRTVAAFLGSTVGNLEPPDAAVFLRQVARLGGRASSLLLATDLHKDRATLELAYNDPDGVTAAFNLNMLVRINRELGAEFPLDAFRHHAWYDEAHRRIEMQLVCERACTVTIPAAPGARHRGATVRFAAGEHITTEYSYKYTEGDVRGLAADSGWRVERSWRDEADQFAVWLLRIGT